MQVAIEEARISLREGNSGFGAVVVKDDVIWARTRDSEHTACDPTAHAEMNAIREAARKLDRNFEGCTLIATHEPCPMCATAIVWSGIRSVGFGYSIQDAIQQGRRRINLPCQEIFDRAGIAVTIHPGILKNDCAILYNRQVREQVEQLRNVNQAGLSHLQDDLKQKRLDWFDEHYAPFEGRPDDVLEAGYQLFLRKLHISAVDAPIVERSSKSITIHSQNFCPTLEACQILGLDTRIICRAVSEEPTDTLLKRLDPRLSFSRNYENIRPYAAYCEEYIHLSD